MKSSPLSNNKGVDGSRKYGFGDLTAPTKFETLEFVEKTKEMSSAKLADLMKISLNHAARLLRGYWTEGLLHRELSTKRHGGIRYFFRLTHTGRARLGRCYLFSPGLRGSPSYLFLSPNFEVINLTVTPWHSWKNGLGMKEQINFNPGKYAAIPINPNEQRLGFRGTKSKGC